ncbi:MULTISPECIES: ATP-binding protein [unclassified Cytobacillus]|uniref:ATP-binding protein n=1 Tax=unclassified Cytobacillus TaxID=2675268 RepID=UPI001359DFD8|nr:ATP-binding protein [Cytobacillus sp. AMY 15.2]KAF0816742.1 Two-component system sensor histidine kinase [Bacillus sp. ZZV12-4809]MCM3094147.1 PAS domain S-box protein [Cytobacillus sp. AMY 15.2]
MILLDYIVNLSIFSLLVSVPLILRSFISHKPLKDLHLLGGVYAGIISVILVGLSFNEQGYSYDIRYAILILVFSYLGPGAGVITAIIALVTRLAVSENWLPAIVGLLLILLAFIVVHRYAQYHKAVRKTAMLYGAYCIVYIITVPIIFNVFRDRPIFHLEYLLFVGLGVIVGSLLIESYEKLIRIITEKKRMEMTLEESESKYRLIAENTSDLIAVMGRNRSFSYLSPSHEFVLGYKVMELQDMEIDIVIHPDEAEKFREGMQWIFEHNEQMTMEFRLRHRNGHWIEFESRSMPVEGQKGVIEHVVMISRDISERKKAEEFLLQSEKLSIVGELAAGVAHEIRNPLTTIKGFLQLYRSDNSQINELLLSELERIENITTEMLSLGKPQAIKMETADLKDIIVNTVELLSPQANMNGIQFKLHFTDGVFLISCEKNQIKQVLLNILKNAMEAMDNGGDIEISLRSNNDGECIVSFQGQGCGIPDEFLTRLGEPFYTLKEKGTGLGLMICHKIIKQHNGTIVYKSKIGEGTLIDIALPLLKTIE